MQLRIRRMLYISFIVAFLIIAPIITLYATGYSYSFKKNKIEKTGIIFIESEPKDAEVFINGEYKKNTPAKFRRVLPDVYEVTVSKEGYHSWKKELRVESNLTTFANDIVLFKNTLPINIVEGEINIFTLSPDRTKLVYSVVKKATEEVRLLNLKNGDDFLIEEINLSSYNDLVAQSWSSQNHLLLNKIIGDFNNYLVVETGNLSIIDIFDITRNNFAQVKWGDDGNLYGLRRAVLHQVNLTDKTDSTVLSANITDFQIKNGDIIFIEKVANESILNKTSLQIADQSQVKIKLPSPSDFYFHNSAPGFISLIDERNQDLFILRDRIFENKDIASSIVLQDKAKKISWSDDRRHILFYNDFEISVFNAVSGNKNLITRYGNQINQAFWYKNESYIIYQIEDLIKVIESSGQKPKNDIILTKLPEVEKIAIDNSGKNIYIAGSAGTQSGIFRLGIQ